MHAPGIVYGPCKQQERSCKISQYEDPLKENKHIYSVLKDPQGQSNKAMLQMQ